MNTVSHPNMFLDSPSSYNSGFQVLQNLFDFFFLVLFGNYIISFFLQRQFLLKIIIHWSHSLETVGEVCMMLPQLDPSEIVAGARLFAAFNCLLC